MLGGKQIVVGISALHLIAAEALEALAGSNDERVAVTNRTLCSIRDAFLVQLAVLADNFQQDSVTVLSLDDAVVYILFDSWHN